MRAGDRAIEIGDGGDERWPGVAFAVARIVRIAPIPAAGMKAERSALAQIRDAAFAQIRLCDCARKRLRHREQTPCRFGRAGRRWRLAAKVAGRLGPWQAEKPARFIQGIPQRAQAFVGSDQIEQIAMIAGRGIGPFAGCALAVVGGAQADIEAAAGIVVDVADQPIASFAPAIGEIVTAHRLGLSRETACQLRGWSLHRDRPVRLRHGRCRPGARCARANGGQAGRRAPMRRSPQWE
jgi:hypothetical protein